MIYKLGDWFSTVLKWTAAWMD